MSTFITEAIVLHKKTVYEDDRLYILYTPEYGKIEAHVLAAASTKSKLAGSVEPIVKSQLMIIAGKNREIIGGAQILQTYFFANPAVDRQLAVIRELFVRLVKPGVREPLLYEKLNSYLNFLKNDLSQKNAVLLNQRFIWQMLKILGLAPFFTRGGKATGEALNFNTDFQNLKQNFSQESENLLNACLDEKTDGLNGFSESSWQQLQLFTRRYLEYFMESDLKSLASFNYYA